MLSHTSISSKSRTIGWARSFLGASGREPTARAGGESVKDAAARTSHAQDVAAGK